MNHLAWSLNFAYMATIYWLSSQPQWIIQVPLFPGVDKILHAGCYFWLGVLWAWSLRASGMRGRRLVLAAWIMASLYGLSDEFHQSFVPGREADGLDWLSDVIGAALGAVLLPRLLRKKDQAA